MEQFINVLKNDPDHAYDHICENYYKLSKDELKDIVKELLYAIYKNVTTAEHNEVLNDVATYFQALYEE